MRYFVANIICFHSEYNEPTQLLSSCSKNPIFAVDEHITENVRSAYHNHCRAIYGAVCIQPTDFPCDNCENTRTLSYYHQQIGGMTHLPLGLGHCMRYIPFYVLTFIVLLSFTRAVPRQMVQKTPWLIYLSLNWANYMHVLRKSPIIPHDDVIKWKHFPRNWPFVRGIHRSRWIPHTKASDAGLPVNSPHKGPVTRSLMFSLICAWINRWVINREAGDLRRYRAHYDVIVMHLVFGMLPMSDSNWRQAVVSHVV